MRRWAIAAVMAAAVCAGAWKSRGQEVPASLSQLPAIRKDLASVDFAVREAAQKRLEKIPASQVEALRAASKTEPDPEVKARLDERIEAMEIYNLLHPGGLSLKVQAGDLAAVAADLNRQLGEGVTLLQGRGGGPYTLDVKDKPFGEILELLQAQQPLQAGTTTFLGANGINVQVILQPQNALPLAAVQPALAASGSFAVMSQLSGNPATGTWGVRITVISDPRIRITQYLSVVQVDKVTDQDGHSLMPAVMSTAGGTGTLGRPAPTFSTMAQFSPVAGVTKISELHAKASFSVLTAERQIALEIDKLPDKPIETSRGALTLETNAAGNILLRFQPVAGQDAAIQSRSLPVMAIISSKDGRAVTTSTTTGSQLMLSGAAIKAAGDGARAVVSWVESSRDCVLPIDLKDIELPGR